MIRISQLLALGTVGLLSLAGCSNPDQASNPSVVDSSQQASTDAAKDAAGAANTAADAAKDAAGAANDTAQNTATSGTVAMGAGELMSVVTNTETAVEAGDFAKAKEEFAKFGDSWSKVGEGIKTASSDGYTAIETNVGNVNTALGEAQPDKTKVMDALTALSTSIASVAKP
ncbi:MAG: hypothetical protein KME11_11805 [Timaviella obliquedivisa GSE-PSE-MK23-08B]|jgi:hypothetical protein|nr:hypothetical protein [Timaviella obliquedivisa GSE-PSE-MK23-08B]